MVFLEFKDIKKRFGKREVLTGVSFFIEEKELFGIVGTSGCGKSTLFKIILGMIRPDRGAINFEGRNVLANLNYLRKNTGVVTQENMLFNELTLFENSLYLGKLYGMRRKDVKEKFMELVKLLGLEDFKDTLISHLSGGMQKRANILVALIHGPKLLILDEPTVGLDSLLRASIWEYINRVNNEGTTILVVSHLLDEIEKNCDRIGILKGGKIFALASMDQYKNTYGKDKSFKEIFESLLK